MKRILELALTLALAGLAMGQTDIDPPTAPKSEKVGMIMLSAAQGRAHGAYLKNPKDPAVRKAYIDSTLNFAYFLAHLTTVGFGHQNEAALYYFREVLKVDPQNKFALKWKYKIAMMYKAQGQPVPSAATNPLVPPARLPAAKPKPPTKH